MHLLLYSCKVSLLGDTPLNVILLPLHPPLQPACACVTMPAGDTFLHCSGKTPGVPWQWMRESKGSSETGHQNLPP